MATHKPFRELLPPGTNFEFIAKQRRWITLSVIFCLACIAVLFINKQVRGAAMNWSTDFRGGTEIIFRFAKAGSGEAVEVDPGVVRQSLRDGGHEVEVSDFSWKEETADGNERDVSGMLIRTVEFGAMDEVERERVRAAFLETFKDKNVLRAIWSGDNLDVRSTQPITWAEAEKFFTAQKHTLKPWAPEQAQSYGTAEEGTGEYNLRLAISGLDEIFRKAISDGIGPGTDVAVVNSYAVGAKAGEKLRNDGIASLFYAIILVMAYLAIRFDVRYAPGAVVAMLHDAIAVVGVFAVTWTEVSLTTVAALLTVVGYSVNDTVIIFDRIRENAHRLKDKKFARIINISINETISRSLLTSLTVFVTTLMMNVFGAGLVRNFAFAMNIGVIVGAYSSIFIASPVVLWIHNKFYSGPPSQRGIRNVDEAVEEPTRGDLDDAEPA